MIIGGYDGSSRLLRPLGLLSLPSEPDFMRVKGWLITMCWILCLALLTTGSSTWTSKQATEAKATATATATSIRDQGFTQNLQPQIWGRLS